MKSLSISAAWQDTQVFLRREAALLVPVSLLFIAVPLALMMMVIPPELRTPSLDPNLPKPEMPGWTILVIISCSLIAMGGILSLYAMALKSAISVREALIMGFRRLGVALGASIIIGLVAVVPALLLVVVSQPLAVAVMFVVAVLLSIRLLMLNCVVIDQPAGVIDTLKRSWAITQGQMLRLLGFLIIITIPIMLGRLVCEMLLGLVGFMIGGKELGLLTSAVGAATALALGQLVMIVMISRLYRQLTQ
ncbi:MAG: hypothetical protein KDE67_12675 [Sphingobium sp.]|nr:hypothetical protein [Sphingobium sp.]MCP5400677.1 hypothetical protein [Sphingomonas sp.]